MDTSPKAQYDKGFVIASNLSIFFLCLKILVILSAAKYLHSIVCGEIEFNSILNLKCKLY